MPPIAEKPTCRWWMDGSSRTIRRDCFPSGKFHHVALIAGTNADEGTLLGGPPVTDLAQLREVGREKVGPLADRLLTRCIRQPTDADAHAAAAAASGDLVFLYGTRSVTARRVQAESEHVSISVHAGEWRGTADPLGRLSCFRDSLCIGRPCPIRFMAPGPCSSETSLSTRTLTMGRTPALPSHERRLGGVCQNRQPQRPGTARWPAFAAGKESYMEFGDQIAAKQSLRKKQLDFMSEFTEGLRSHNTTASSTRPKSSTSPLISLRAR